MTRGSRFFSALSLIVALNGCSIRKLAEELAQTIIPVDDGGSEASPTADPASIPGRPVHEPAPPPAAKSYCTGPGHLCLDDPGDGRSVEAFLQAAEVVEGLLEGLPESVHTALFSRGRLSFALGDGGVRSLGFDRFGTGPRLVVTLAPADLSVDALVVRTLEAHVLGLNPATGAADATTLARAFAMRYGLLPAASEAPAEAAILGPTAFDRAGADGTFLSWLDERVASERGALLDASLYKAARGRDDATWRTAGDPWFVLTRNFSGTSDGGPKLTELMLRRALEVSSTVPGRAGLAFRWDEPLPKKARRLSAGVPVEPTGVTWFRFERDPKHPANAVAFAAEWEAHARFRCFVQLVDHEGALVRTQRLAVPERGLRSETMVEGLDRVASIVFGALSEGDPSAPFDPREGPWEPHALLLTVAPTDGDGGFFE